MFNKTIIDPSKVGNIYALLTAFLLIVESLLGFWMYKAGGTFERIITGLLIVTVFLAFLFLIYKIQNILSTPKPKVDDQSLTPASKEVSVEEIESANNEQISGPGGTYTINTPPDNWNIKYVDIHSLVKENLNISESTTLFPDAAAGDEQKNILLLQSKNLYEIIPVPGKTVVNGRVIPTALTTRIPSQLAIIPLERLQPPFYSENPFVHNVYTFIGQMIQNGLVNMQKNFSGVIPKTGRDFIQADLVQQLEHVDFVINNEVIKDCTGIKNNITVIGIKGDIVDHLLLMYYPSWPENNIFNILNDELQILKSLANSFRPLKETKTAEKLNSTREKGKKGYELFLHNMGDSAFWTEMFIALSRIRGLNEKNSADQKRIISYLKPFRQLYAEMKMNEPDLDTLWINLTEAENGKPQPLLDALNELIKDMDAQMEADTTPTDDVKKIGP